MRIITGKYKGRHFDIPRTFKARPTTDFAKENIFNVLTQYVDLDGAEALDLFAGTGSITLEMLSRGCSSVVSIELERDHHRFIMQCLEKLQRERGTGQETLNVKCIRGDVFQFLKRCRLTFDFIFADPPYALKQLPQIPDLVLGGDSGVTQDGATATGQRSLLKPEGILVLEHGKDYDFSQHPHFVEHREYGSVNFSMFR